MPENEQKNRKYSQPIQTTDDLWRLIFRDLEQLLTICVSRKRDEEWIRFLLLTSLFDVVDGACNHQERKKQEENSEGKF